MTLKIKQSIDDNLSLQKASRQSEYSIFFIETERKVNIQKNLINELKRVSLCFISSMPIIQMVIRLSNYIYIYSQP